MIQLLTGATAANPASLLSKPLSVRPAKSSPFDMTIYARSTVMGDTFNVEVSPTCKSDDWWDIKAVITCNTALENTNPQLYDGEYKLTDECERLRVRFNGMGVGDAGVVPET